MQHLRSLLIRRRPQVRFASSKDWINYCTGLAPTTLQRASNLRKDTAWIKAQQSSPDSDFMLFMGMRPVAEFVSGSSLDLQFSRFNFRELEPYLTRETDPPQCVFLGMDGARPLFLVGFDEKESALLNDERHILSGFVSVKPLVDRRLLCYARSILTWNKSHLFCSACGAPTNSSEGGHKRMCSNGSCSRFVARSYGDTALSHPRTDPAILAVVTHGSCCLLARKDGFPPSILSCVAGFVEPGETLEDAVAREVFEETGLNVTSVHYVLSQPWPFDSVLKLGCIATVDSSDFTLDTDELSFGDWFSLEEVRQMLNHKHEKWQLAPHLLLANQMLVRWVEETSK